MAAHKGKREIRIYFEGNRGLRSSFESFFSKAGLRDSRIVFVAAKNGPGDYRKARRSHPDAWNILLKDSEQEMPQRAGILCARFGIDAAFEKDVFWMVQRMEAWFLADLDTLKAVYGDGFSAKSIQNIAGVEVIRKADVIDRLRRAAKRTAKGEYDKVAHAPRILERLDPALVQKCAQHFRRLLTALTRK